MIPILRKLYWMTQRSRREADLRDELQFHMDQEADQPPAAARRERGNLALLMEDTRAQWGWPTLDRFSQDLRYALRMFRQNLAALFCAPSVRDAERRRAIQPGAATSAERLRRAGGTGIDV